MKATFRIWGGNLVEIDEWIKRETAQRMGVDFGVYKNTVTSSDDMDACLMLEACAQPL